MSDEIRKVLGMIIYVANRFKERSTWIGLTAVLTSLGYHFTDVQIDDIITIGTAICGLVVTLWPDEAVKIKKEEPSE